jgi:NAD(P)H-hydrate epimerase
VKVVSVAEMRELERETFDAGTSPVELQAQAGAAVAAVIARCFPATPVPRVALALIGTGNNGRDAWIAAERLLEQGWTARLLLTPGHAISDDELGSFEGLGGQALWLRGDAEPPRSVESSLESADVVIDGLLGIGAHGAPREPLASLIQQVNRTRLQRPNLRVVAVDVPSGLDADTGQAAGSVVHADVTVVLGAMKRGLLTTSALTVTGELQAVDIGLVAGPDGAFDLVTEESLRGLLPARAADAHKGTFGRLLVVAGSEQYVGAALLVCGAALRAGVGLVALAAPRWLRDVVAARLPEVTYVLLPDEGPAGAPEVCADAVRAALTRYTAVAVGPGLSQESGVPRFAELVLRHAAAAAVPMVLDADALNTLAGIASWSEWIGHGAVLTPHLGELARLRGDDGNPPDWTSAGELGSRWGATLVIKGPFTAIGSKSGRWVHARPNPALATAGTGDVLTGIIGAFLARGLSPDEAARGGVAVHALAGAYAGSDLPGGGLTASDLLPAIPQALKPLVQGF